MLTERRPGGVYAGLLAATVALGLATRWYPAAFPAVVAQYGGDVLWAGMVAWLVALLRPSWTTVRVALAAFAIALVVECSQLYHADWIDGLRATRPGALVLGQGFLWSDLLSYAVGIALVAALDRWLTRSGTRARSTSSIG